MIIMNIFSYYHSGTYFITAQQVLEKLSIQKTKHLLRLNFDVASLSSPSGHHCEKCTFEFDEDVLDTIASLKTIESKIETETKLSIVYIAGYLVRNDDMSETELFESTTFYHQSYGTYLDDLDRGGLQVPTDKVCQWVSFCYSTFGVVKNRVCRNSLADVFMTISNIYSLNQTTKRARSLSNILLNNHCKITTPRSKKEPSQKVLKLSSEE